jgi:hypothetical protein
LQCKLHKNNIMIILSKLTKFLLSGATVGFGFLKRNLQTKEHSQHQGEYFLHILSDAQWSIKNQILMNKHR